MIPSDDKTRQMALRAYRVIENEPGVKVMNPDAVRRALKNGIEEGVKILSGIDLLARNKIKSLSRRVAEGTREWDELYAKYVAEERSRRGV